MNVVETRARLPVYAVSHGGGPWPWIKHDFIGDWSPLERSLQSIPGELPATPRAILCVSAHWVTDGFTVQTNPNPPMLYDYTGFPVFTYSVRYPAPGSPELAGRVTELLGASGVSVRHDAQRGFDHGTFVPLVVAFPAADIPVVQLSLDRGFDPAEHIAVGRALAPLRDEGVLVLGSGVPSFHNLSMLGPRSTGPSTEFDHWVTETLVGHSGPNRNQRLQRWANAPGARVCHPQPDHLLPVMVAAGAAENDPAFVQYHEDAFMGWTASSSYRFGDPLPSRR